MTGFHDFKVERLDWSDERLGSIALPKGRLSFTQSFGSGLSRRRADPPGCFWAAGDRGPNLKIGTLLSRYGAEHLAPLSDVAGAKVMPRLDIGPRIARLQVEEGAVRLVRSLPVLDKDGRPVSGLPMAASAHCESEPVFDLDGRPIPPDPSGLDSEGIAALEGGGFILSEEFGPSLVRLDGEARVVARYVPEGSDLGGALYPVHATLPAIAARRRLNRGFEAIAVSDDQKSLYVAFQSPLAHPDEETHARARHVRVWRLELATMRVVAQYLYPLDPPGSFLRDGAEGEVGWSDLKVSEMICLPGGALLVLERGSETTKIYRVQPCEAEALPPEHLDVAHRPTVEALSGEGKALKALAKRLIFSSDEAPEVSADLEGMALLSEHALLLVNDNDFGVEGAETVFWTLSFAAPIDG